MATTLTERERLLAAATKFAEDHENVHGVLSREDTETFDAMLAAAKALPSGGRSFRTQRDLDENPPVFNGFGSGARLFDKDGRCYRGLLKGESFEGAIREREAQRGLSQQEERTAKLMDSGELTFGGYIRSMVLGDQSSTEFAALGGSSGPAGGYNVPGFLAASVIDRFRARTVLMKAGAQTIPLESDPHSFVRLTGDATAAWRHENVAINESEPTFGAMNIVPRSLAVILRVSRELLQDAPNIEQAIERSFSEAFAVEVDRAGLLGQGAAAEPQGLYNHTGINELASVGTISNYSELLDAHKLLLDDNAPDPTAYITSNREWRTYAGLLDTSNQPMMRPPAVANLPFLTTSAIPTNLGGGTESFAFLGHFPDFVFGIRSELQIDVLREFFADKHQFGFVAHLRLGTGVFHPESFCKLTGITP